MGQSFTSIFGNKKPRTFGPGRFGGTMASSLGPERLRKEHHEYEVVQADVQCLGHGCYYYWVKVGMASSLCFTKNSLRGRSVIETDGVCTFSASL